MLHPMYPQGSQELKHNLYMQLLEKETYDHNKILISLESLAAYSIENNNLTVELSPPRHLTISMRHYISRILQSKGLQVRLH